MRTLRIGIGIWRTLARLGAMALVAGMLTSCATNGGSFARMDFVSVRVNGRVFDAATRQHLAVLAMVDRPNAIMEIVSLLRKAEVMGKELPPEKVVVTDAGQASDDAVWLRIECLDKNGFHSDCDLRGGDLVTIRNRIFRLPADFHLDRDVGRVLQRYGYLAPSVKLELNDESRQK